MWLAERYVGLNWVPQLSQLFVWCVVDVICVDRAAA